MSTNILWSVLVVIVIYISSKGFKRLLNRIGTTKNVPAKRLFYIEKVFEIMLAVTGMVILAFVWSVDIKGISVFASSLFAVIGVALFAQWSILSNVTASIIIFFTFPARIGDRIRIIDGDDSIEGTIREIALFQVELEDAEGNTLLYPNNLLMQKPVKKLVADT